MAEDTEQPLDVDPQEVCFYCLHRLAERVSCVAAATVSGITYRRIPFGQEAIDLWGHFYDAADAAEAGVKRVPLPFCPLCGVPVGASHHAGCEYEECPGCGGFLTACHCAREPFALSSLEPPSPPQMRLPL